MDRTMETIDEFRKRAHTGAVAQVGESLDRLAGLQMLAFAAKCGERDAKRAVTEAQRKAAARAGSPAGLLALFPALKSKT